MCLPTETLNSRSNFAMFATNSLRSQSILHLFTKIGLFMLLSHGEYASEYAIGIRSIRSGFASVGNKFGKFTNYSPPSYVDRSIYKPVC